MKSRVHSIWRFLQEQIWVSWSEWGPSAHARVGQGDGQLTSTGDCQVVLIIVGLRDWSHTYKSVFIHVLCSKLICMEDCLKGLETHPFYLHFLKYIYSCKHEDMNCPSDGPLCPSFCCTASCRWLVLTGIIRNIAVPLRPHLLCLLSHLWEWYWEYFLLLTGTWGGMDLGGRNSHTCSYQPTYF